MGKGMGKGSALRLFVAAYPPSSVVEQLLGLVADVPGLRVTAPEQLHLTLQFIGDTLPRELEDVTESVRRAAAGLGTAAVSVQRLITLPERGRPRLIAAEFSAHPTL